MELPKIVIKKVVWEPLHNLSIVITKDHGAKGYCGRISEHMVMTATLTGAPVTIVKEFPKELLHYEPEKV